MHLRDLLAHLDYRLVSGDLDREIRNVTAHSQQVAPGDLFVCYRGVSQDGHAYIPEALRRGAEALVVEQIPKTLPLNGIPVVQVADGRHALAILAGNRYGNPARQMKIVGITGTNGKTSTAYLAYHILRAAGKCPGLLGTIQYGYGNRWHKASTTTPDALQLQALLREMCDAQVDSVVMEVTSHALAQRRVDGIVYDVAVFTNLTQDHLDFHGDLDTYLAAKMRLFEELLSPSGWAVLNADDPVSECIRPRVQGRVLTYAVHTQQADIIAREVRWKPTGLSFQVCSPRGTFNVELPLLGEYNVSNALAAIAIAQHWDCSEDAIQEGLRQTVVPGRFERVQRGQDFTVVVDYAHTPDALKRVLTEARKFTQGRLICVFGCGGDRDRGKRPLMGQIATRLADYTVITSDNPRREDPNAILRDILGGIQTVPASRYRVIADRAKAIQHALETAVRGDLVVIAGKGHEDYQIIGDQRIHFDDREVAAQILDQMG